MPVNDVVVCVLLSFGPFDVDEDELLAGAISGVELNTSLID